MLRNYFKIALRNLWRHKAFSIVNILGLAVGMTACFLIYLYVHFETSYDAFNTKSDRIYRIISDIKTPSELLQWSSTSSPIAINMQHDFPEVESSVRIGPESFLVRKGNEKFQETNTLVADSTLFSIFDFPLVHGNPATALKEPLSIVFSQTAAKKYFGDANPIGQTVLLTGEGFPALVTGVMKDIPENSQIKADMIVSMSSLRRFQPHSLDSEWINFGVQSFVLLRPNANAKALEAKLPAFVQQHTGASLAKAQMQLTLHLEKLRDVYLYSTRDDSKTGNINNVYIFSIVAIFILAIACINFVNLTTARSADRAKEIGIRKVAGSTRWQLAKQFLGESIVVALLAFVVAVLLSWLLLPLFNQLAGKQVSPPFFRQPVYILYLLGVSLVIGFISGLYPATVLSSFRPVSVLKGRFVSGSGGTILRKGLVIFQFTISIALITATIVVYMQLKYMRAQDLGFNKDQTMVINTNGDPAKESFRQSLTGIPGVVSTTFSSGVPGGDIATAYSKLENHGGEMQTTSLMVYFVDFDYLQQYQMKILAGRGFSRAFGTDTTQAMVINESTAKLLGYSSVADAVGKKFEQWGRQGRIIGVVKDFHYMALQQEIKPMVLRMEPNAYQMLSVKVAANNLPATISAIETKWNAAIPARPFSYEFLDQSFNKQYQDEEQFGRLFLNFAILAIFISCMGLLGLASYSTLQRTKEIGIRKVLGASVSNIVGLLSVDFLKLVLIALLIAVPVSLFSMNKWLQDFAYRIHLTWWMFVLAGILSIIVAFVTISFQAVRAAVANPSSSLRSE